MSVSASSGRKLEFLYDAPLEIDRLEALADGGIRRAARTAVQERGKTERRPDPDVVEQGKDITLRAVFAWSAKAAILAMAYVAVFYGVIVMQISLLLYVVLVAIACIAWIGYVGIRDFRWRRSIVAERE